MKRLSPKPSDCIRLASALASPPFVCLFDSSSLFVSTLMFVRSKLTSDSIFNSLVSVSFTQTSIKHFRILSHVWSLFTFQKPSLAASKFLTKSCRTFQSPASLLIHQNLNPFSFHIIFLFADIQNKQLSHLRWPLITPRSRSQESKVPQQINFHLNSKSLLQYILEGARM